jgi:hypothetical protein
MSKYEPGRKYWVIKEGARLTGMRPTAPYCQIGWSKKLHIGDVLTCAGHSMTFGDGVPALKWKGENGEWLANDCLFQPAQGGMWGGQLPADGYLVLDETSN